MHLIFTHLHFIYLTNKPVHVYKFCKSLKGFKTIFPLHNILFKRALKSFELSFQQDFSKDLAEKLTHLDLTCAKKFIHLPPPPPSPSFRIGLYPKSSGPTIGIKAVAFTLVNSFDF